MAGLGWIDFSPEYRDKVATVINLLKPEGRIDELGIGVIRNALSDLLFPGTSTIQTRAKYFLIVARILKEYQEKFATKKAKPKLAAYLRERENHIIRLLVDKYQDTDELGIIGILLAGTPKSREIVRKPSSIYWTGLRRFNIVRTDLSLSEYIAKHDRQRSFTDLLSEFGDEKGDDCDAGYDDAFGICLPDGNNDWDTRLSIDLTFEEAGFLRDKIIDHHGEKFLGQLLKDKKRMALFVRVANFRDMADLFCQQNISSQNKIHLKLAKDFDELINGAHIRYNCLLQAQFGTEVKMLEFHRQWEAWYQKVRAPKGVVTEFDENLLFSLTTTLKPFTETFIHNWMEGIRRSESTDYLDGLVTAQERSNKGAKARLRPGANEKADQWIGIDGLSYRFPVNRTIVNDIKRGLGD